MFGIPSAGYGRRSANGVGACQYVHAKYTQYSAVNSWYYNNIRSPFLLYIVRDVTGPRSIPGMTECALL